ncbi:outer membrane protein assembly factor BamA [Bradyrhizobium elkanii]|nr:outer membrane protein assembly factor BamA [Bradyrhizobium elkanii]
MKTWRGFVAAIVLSGFSIPGTPVIWPLVAPVAAQSVDAITVEGNRRVEAETIQSYFRPAPGGRLDQAAVDDGLKELVGTGLFQDVKINHAGGRIVVSVIENPVIDRVAFEGNKKIKDEQLSAEMQSKPRGTLSRPMVQSDALLPRFIGGQAATTCMSRRKSSNARTTASISSSPSTRERRPASRPSSSWATTVSRRRA